MLLERELQCGQLAELLHRACAGRGACAQVSGEAGAGKSALLRCFAAGLPAEVACLWAACEPLLTPRPLSPFVDLADRWPPSLARALRDGQRHPGLLADLRDALAQGRHPLVLVLEDLHWADAATLEAVRYLGRRLQGTRLLLVLSWRDDDGEACRALRVMLADLPSADAVRINLPNLSAAAVATLARAAGRSATGLFEATAGNAFFVTETLSDPSGMLSASVRDAVLARLAALSAAARAAAELLAVSPAPLPLALLAALLEDPAALDECCDKGMLRATANGLGFRHELARLAVAQGLAPVRTARLHRCLFMALSGLPQVPAERLVHHAAQAGLDDDVLVLAPRAARAAAAVSAHREAAALYRLALERSATLAEPARAELLDAAADEFRLVGAVDESIAAGTQALALCRGLGDDVGVGRNLRLLAADEDARGNSLAARAQLAQAINTLRPLVSDAARAELARACAEHSRQLSCLSDFAASIAAGDEAVALAESLPASPAAQTTLVSALRSSASARLFVRDDAAAYAALERALAIALTLAEDELVARRYALLQMTSLIYRRHARALAVAEQGMAWCAARDLDLYRARLLENCALSYVETGRWNEAEQALDQCLAMPACSGRLRHSVQFLQARLRLRRADRSSAPYWQALGAAPQATPVGYRLPAVLTACAEAAWLLGDNAAARAHALAAARAAIAAGDARLLGPPLVWLARLNAALPAHGLPLAPEHALELAGQHGAATAVWHGHGCPYEAALAGLHGDECAARAALETLLGLQAALAADIARARLCGLGIKGLRAGPNRATRQDPAGLTPRQRQVHALLEQGLSNAGIAARLHRSPRTVENHVAQVLSKLGLRSRAQLTRAAG